MSFRLTMKTLSCASTHTPLTCPITQFSGNGFGQLGSTTNFGTTALRLHARRRLPERPRDLCKAKSYVKGLSSFSFCPPAAIADDDLESVGFDGFSPPGAISSARRRVGVLASAISKLPAGRCHIAAQRLPVIAARRNVGICPQPARKRPLNPVMHVILIAPTAIRNWPSRSGSFRTVFGVRLRLLFAIDAASNRRGKEHDPILGA